MTWVMWNLILAYLETVFASVPYRCTVSAERTIGSEILGDEGLVESYFGPFGDIVTVGTR